MLKEFLARIDRVNSDVHFLLGVKRAVVFGSYLGERDRLGDLDLAVELKVKERNPERAADAWIRRIKQAENDGRTFLTKGDRALWPEIEVRMFLKSRSRTISLHDIDDGILGRAPVKEIYPRLIKAVSFV